MSSYRKRHNQWLDDSDEEDGGERFRHNNRYNKRHGDDDDVTMDGSSDEENGSSSDENEDGPKWVAASSKSTRRSRHDEDHEEDDDMIPQSFGLGAKKQVKPRPDKDFASFEKYSKGIGSKLMQKMGYVMGQGLGKQGTGLAAPIDVKLRPQRAGLGNVDEKTETLKRAQKESRKRDSTKKGADEQEKPQGWKKHPMETSMPSKRKYKSAQQVIDEQVLPTTAEPIKSKIIDMTGKESRVIQDISESTSSFGEFKTEGYLVELKHNTRLLADMALSDLERASRQNKMELSRLEKLNTQLRVMEETKQKEAVKLERYKAVLQIVHDLQHAAFQYSANMNGISTGDVSEQDWFQVYEPFFQRFAPYMEEYHDLRLDRLLVAAILPHFKIYMAEWDPLASPGWGLNVIQKWRSLFQIVSPTQHEKGILHQKQKSTMSPFDTMLYLYWLPRIRSCINNDWNPKHPEALIAVMETWNVSLVSTAHTSLLPSWMSHNIAYQLLLPKLTRAVQDWRPSSKNVTLVHMWLHPWLPILGDAMESLWSEIRRKFESFFRDFDPSDATFLQVMIKWKDIFSREDVKRLLKNTILPSLEIHLRHRFRIDPASQDLVPLVDHVFPWSAIVPPRHFSDLFETAFFPQWQHTLWVWITSASANLEEITLWYQNWKRVFEPLADLTSVKEGFREGLDKMNQGLSLRSSDNTRPSIPIPPVQKSRSVKSTAETTIKTATGAIAEAQLSFKEYVESLASEQNIPLVPLNRLHPDSGKPLYRLGGLNMYMDKELVYLQQVPRGEYTFVGVDDALSIAQSTMKRL